jgi:hypothetical protein
MRTVQLLPALAAMAVFSTHAADWLYLTVPGDTLSGIGQAYLNNPKDWPKIQTANGVRVPKHLPANSRLKIPVELLKVTPAAVNVVAVKGNARFKRADGPFQPLVSGATLTGGETVLTGPGASVSYQFADNTRLTQQATSKLSFGRLASYGKTGMVSTEISLDSGRMEASATKQLAPAGGFKVRTPIAVAGLRGTEFRLNVAEDGKTMRNEVTEGAVAVSAQGQEVQVDAGFGTFAELGKPPAPPTMLLAKPDLSALPGKLNRLPANLAWPENPAAQAWRIQLSEDANFLTLLRDDLVTQATMELTPELPDGDYFLRVRGVNQLGLEGFNANHAFSLSARPLPPMPQKPALGERIAQHEIELAWHTAEGAQGYLLQLAPTPEFGQGVIERRLPSISPTNESTRETLASGEWHWRIASLDAQGQPRAFSPHRAFRVQPPPAIPLLLPESENQLVTTKPEVKLQWHASAETEAYHVQIAADPDFAQQVVNQRTTETHLSTPSKAPGNWYWRVAALGVDDVSQGFSKTASWRYQPLPAQPEMPKIRLDYATLSVVWSGAAPAYRLELSRNQAFTEVIARPIVHVPEAHLTKPAAGTYWLRVIALNADNQESPPSASVQIEVQSAFKPWWLLPFLIFVP